MGYLSKIWFHALVLSSLLIHAIKASPKTSQDQTTSIESMATQICTNIDDQMSCLVNIHSRLQDAYPEHHNRLYNATVVLTAAMEVSLNKAELAKGLLTRVTSLSASGAREQLAVEDCRELLDYTVTELAWSMAEMRKLRSIASQHALTSTDDDKTSYPTTNDFYVHHGQQHHPAAENMRAWLSAAMSNQDTCLEGFEGTTRHVERFIKGSLTQVTQLVTNVLTLYTKTHGHLFLSPPPPPPRGGGGGHYYPDWMNGGDKELVSSFASPKTGMQVDAVVASDGSGHYASIGEAVAQAPNYSARRYVIHVKKGFYNENIDLKKKKTNIMLVGDGIGATFISGNRNFMQGWTTFRTPTFAVSGRGFIARDITFRNTAGARNHQAVALRVDSDQSAFFHCSIEGYQDTLYAHSLRQFYRECNIYGTIDFLFGNGAAVFQNCNFYTRVPLPLQKVTVAAQGRKSPHQSTGFTIQDSYVFATQPTYLGRPWKEYSRVVYMNTYLGPLVQPRGWLEWFGDFALGSCYFGEFRNNGPGASLSGRVNWPGFHVMKDPSEALFFTAARFIDGMSWLPATGVKFSAGLTR